MKNTIRACVFAGLAASLLLPQATAQEGGQTTAVMPLGCTGLPASDAEFMTERLMIELTRSGGLEVMERDRRDEILREGDFQRRAACDAVACLVEAGRLLAVGKIVGGSIGQIGQVVSIQVRMIDLRTGAVERTAVRDYSGGVDVVLTRGMREVALELTGKLEAQARDEVKAPPATPRPKPAPAAEKYVRAKPSSGLKAPRLTYGSLALAAGFGMLALICERQAGSFQDAANDRLADSYRSKGRKALIAASGSAAVGLLTSFMRRPADGK